MRLVLVTVGLVMVAGAWQPAWAAPAQERLALALAPFSADPAATKDAAIYQRYLHQALDRLRAGGCPLDVQILAGPVGGPDEKAKRQKVLVLNGRRGHLVLWAEVERAGGQVYLQPRLTLARQPRFLPGRPNPRLVDLPPWERAPLTQPYSGAAAALPAFIEGISYYVAGQWDRALARFQQDSSPAGQLYSGLCLFERGLRGPRPWPDLQGAAAAFDRVAANQPGPLKWLALSVRGDTLQALAVRAPFPDSISLLLQAATSYRQALDGNGLRTSYPQEWAAAEVNLGVAVSTMGSRLSGPPGEQRLADAIAAFDAALRVLTRATVPLDWARTQRFRGDAQHQLALRRQGPDQVRLLQAAAASYRATLQVFTPRQTPTDWAIVQGSLGDTLQALGQATSGAAGAKDLQEAGRAYQAALQVYTRNRYPREWAENQAALANVRQYLGQRTAGAAGQNFLVQAVAAYQAALAVITRQTAPIAWGETQNNLAIACLELGRRVSGAEAGRWLSQAVAAHRAALAVFDRTRYPQQWAGTQAALGNALRAQAEAAQPFERAPLLHQAADAYQAALDVYTPAAYPQQQGTVRRNLDAVLRVIAGQPPSGSSR